MRVCVSVDFIVTFLLIRRRQRRAIYIYPRVRIKYELKQNYCVTHSAKAKAEARIKNIHTVIHMRMDLD